MPVFVYDHKPKCRSIIEKVNVRVGINVTFLCLLAHLILLFGQHWFYSKALLTRRIFVGYVWRIDGPVYWTPFGRRYEPVIRHSTQWIGMCYSVWQIVQPIRSLYLLSIILSKIPLFSLLPTFYFVPRTLQNFEWLLKGTWCLELWGWSYTPWEKNWRVPERKVCPFNQTSFCKLV